VALVVSNNPGFEGQPTPPLYAWVKVVTITDPRHDDHFLDLALHDGIETLGQAVGKNAPWHKRDIILEAPPPEDPPSLTLCSQRMVTPAQVHGKNTPEEVPPLHQSSPDNVPVVSLSRLPSPQQQLVATTICSPSFPEVQQEANPSSQQEIVATTICSPSCPVVQ